MCVVVDVSVWLCVCVCMYVGVCVCICVCVVVGVCVWVCACMQRGVNNQTGHSQKLDISVVTYIPVTSLCYFPVVCAQQISDMKPEFLWIVCDHEHFVALNLPFPVECELLLPGVGPIKFQSNSRGQFYFKYSNDRTFFHSILEKHIGQNCDG